MACSLLQEFPLEGAVHASGNSGRIDILAYNPDTKRFVVFELKKNFDKNVGHQATNYRHYIKKNFLKVYLNALQKYKVTLPNEKELDNKEVEIILIAQKFPPHLIEQAEAEEDDLITLVEYNWYQNDYLLLDYVVNAPLEPLPPLGAKEPGTEERDKNWARIQWMLKFREKRAMALPDGPKKEELENFIHIVKDCIVNRNAQLLFDTAESSGQKRRFFKKYAEMILQQQNISDTIDADTSNTGDDV